MKATEEIESQPTVLSRRADHLVTAHQTTPGRAVLTEHGNTDAWIASDYTVSLKR